MSAQDAAKDAAFWCGMNILATLREVVGFENVVQVHKLVGFVNCVDGFEAQPTVINGCSDLLYEVLGDKGRHARSAVGVIGSFSRALMEGASREKEPMTPGLRASLRVASARS